MSSYVPLDLSREKIKNIFTGCLEHSLTEKRIECVLFKKENGFKEDSRPIVFDANRLNQFKYIFEGLFGQLNDVHQKQKITSPTTISKKYDGTTWLTSKQGLIEFLHLATALNILGPLKTDNTMPIIKEIYPTLSPEDPEFNAWYDEYRPTLMKRIEKEDGQEPADD